MGYHYPIMKLGISAGLQLIPLLFWAVVGISDDHHVVMLGSAGHQANAEALTHSTTTGIDGIRGLLKRVGHSSNSQKKLTALGESLGSMNKQATLPEIKNFAKELMSEFMDDATAGGAGTQSNDKFNALVANIAQKLRNGDIGGRGTEMVSKLVKEAVQAQILRSGGRGGEVENMEIPSGDDEEGGKSSEQMEQEASQHVDEQVSGEFARRKQMRDAARTLEVQKAKERESEAQAKVDQLTKDEEDERKKVAKLAIDEETLREEAAHAHNAAASPKMARKMASEQADIAMKLAQEVSAAEDKLHAIQQTARKSLAATLVKDRDAKMAQQALITNQDALESGQGSEKAVILATKNTEHKIHQTLAREILKVEDATAEKERAQRTVARAEKSVDRAETPQDREDAEVKLAAASAALTQATQQEEMDVKARDTATVVAGQKKMTASLAVASNRAQVQGAEAQVNTDGNRATNTEAKAAEAQKQASVVAIESNAASAQLREVQARAEAAAQKAAETKRMQSPAVANEVATKKAIAVASTNFVKRQAAAKVLLIQKKKEALEELEVIRVVAARLAAETPTKQGSPQASEEDGDDSEPSRTVY